MAGNLKFRYVSFQKFLFFQNKFSSIPIDQKLNEDSEKHHNFLFWRFLHWENLEKNFNFSRFFSFLCFSQKSRTKAIKKLL